MRRIDRHGRYHRENFPFKISIQPLQLRLSGLLRRDKAEAFRFQCLQDLLQVRILFAHKTMAGF